MKNIDILVAFELEIGKIDDQLDKPKTEDSLFWLNSAINKFVKLRFNGDFVHYTGYELTAKRTEDLVKLFEEQTFTEPKDFIVVNTHVDYDEYPIVFPEGYLYTLNEDVIITDVNGDYSKDTCIFECTQDSFMYRINNSLTDFHYRNHKARPLRIRTTNGCKLLTDKKYKIKQYTLGYLRKPTEITIDDPYTEYTDFRDDVMSEIIKIAAQMYLENIGSERYKTISQEVLTQE